MKCEVRHSFKQGWYLLWDNGWISSMPDEATARTMAATPELVAALRNIVSLDSDAHPGLLTWQDARRQAHDEAVAAIAEATKDTP